MSDTRDKIIQKLKNNPEKGADAFIRLQREFKAKTAECERLREEMIKLTSIWKIHARAHYCSDEEKRIYLKCCSEVHQALPLAGEQP